jgi:putative hydrolases of HD superfamily
MSANRLKQQINFFVEVDKLKQITRQNYLADGTRKENDAEHSWHLALMCILFREYASGSENLDLLRVIKMVLIHDLVEIDAGDTYCYDRTASIGKAAREQRAADRLFKLLPPDQEIEFRNLWDEFEGRSTPEACFAAALDRLQPLTLNYRAQGKSWQEHNVNLEQVLARNSSIANGAPALWDFARKMIGDAVEKGILQEES